MKRDNKPTKLDKVKWLLTSGVAIHTVLLFATIASAVPKRPPASGD